MSHGHQGEAFDGPAALTKHPRAMRIGPTATSGTHPIDPSLRVHDAIVRLTGCDNHVQVIPR